MIVIMCGDRKLSRAVAVATGLLVCTALAPAFAQDGGAEPAPLLGAAERAERSFELAEAESLYRRVVEAAPGSREARRARARIDYLEARRDPARGYAPLEALERARRADLDRARAEAFAREVDAMPAGRVKRDALFLLGETWLRRLGDPARARGYYDALIDAPGVTDEEAELARFARAEAIDAAGDRAAAIEAMDEAGLGATFEARELRAQQLRARLRVASIALLAIALALLVVTGRPWRAGRAGLRRALAWPRLLAYAYVIAVPAAIAELYERGTAETFLLFGAFTAPVLFLASLAAESAPARARRTLTLLSAAAAPIAIAYLVLESVDGLASFGL
jgi:hypothetical protein